MYANNQHKKTMPQDRQRRGAQGSLLGLRAGDRNINTAPRMDPPRVRHLHGKTLRSEGGMTYSRADDIAYLVTIKKPPCHCEAYPFPHRKNGGECEGKTEPSPWDDNPQRHDPMYESGHSNKDFK
jgi:hypothetical protein